MAREKRCRGRGSRVVFKLYFCYHSKLAVDSEDADIPASWESKTVVGENGGSEVTFPAA